MDVIAFDLHHLLALPEILHADGALGFSVNFLDVFFCWKFIQVALFYALVHLSQSRKEGLVQKLLCGIHRTTTTVSTSVSISVSCSHPRPQQSFQQVWIHQSISIPISITVSTSILVHISHQANQLLHTFFIELYSVAVRVALAVAFMLLELFHWKFVLAVGAFDHQSLTGSHVLLDVGQGDDLAACWTKAGLLVARRSIFGVLLLLLLDCRGIGLRLGLLISTRQPMVDVVFFVYHIVAGFTEDGCCLLVAGLHPHVEISINIIYTRIIQCHHKSIEKLRLLLLSSNSSRKWLNFSQSRRLKGVSCQMQ